MGVVYIPFEEARSYMRKQGLTSVKAWWEWSPQNRPEGIPSSPDRIYKGRGWAGWPDFLGYTVRKKGLMGFEEARKYARGLGFTRMAQWKEWRSSGERPESLPFAPNLVYADRGWDGWPDFLGYAPLRGKDFVSYEEAREFACELSLSDREAWRAWTCSGECPTHIPRRPESVYKGKGWQSWEHFLGIISPAGEKASSGVATDNGGCRQYG